MDKAVECFGFVETEEDMGFVEDFTTPKDLSIYVTLAVLAASQPAEAKKLVVLFDQFTTENLKKLARLSKESRDILKAFNSKQFAEVRKLVQAATSYLALDPYISQSLDDIYLTIKINITRMVA